MLSGGGRHSCNYYDVISLENLFEAWQEFKKGKRSKIDVAQFELNLENNIFGLHNSLLLKNWKPDPYEKFFVRDPKLREIHKASVRDRVLYQAIYRKLYHIFDPSFIVHSYSSRNFKGTYVGILAFEKYIRKVGENYTRPGHVLKCDIRKFFDSIDHNILYNFISKKVEDTSLLFLVRQIIDSFEKTNDKGLPLGNVTSQLFSNIYLNELDQYIKHGLKEKYYVRYCDDFVLVSDSLKYLEGVVEKIEVFCKEKLLLDIHPNKILFRKVHQGVDFLGFVSLPYRRALRTKTKNRILRKLENLREKLDKRLINIEGLNKITHSYLGILSHCKGEKITEQIERMFWD